MVEETPTPRIVEAVFTSANTGELGARKSPLAKMIEKAMSDAVTKALADGVPMSNTDEIRRRMQEARAKVKAWYSQKVVELSAAMEKDSK